MEKATKELLIAQNIPVHVQNLLELVGICFLNDFLEINEEFIENIEERIKEGKVVSQINFASKASRIKYFGIDLHDVGSFEFRILDKIKLLRLSTAAQEKLKRLESKRTHSSEHLDSDIECEDTEATDPKKIKLENDRLNRATQKIIEDSNSLLALMNFDERVDQSHVTAFYIESGKMSGEIQCLLCTPERTISLNGSKYSVAISNYKRHVSLLHIKKAATQETIDKKSAGKIQESGDKETEHLWELLEIDGECEEPDIETTDADSEETTLKDKNHRLNRATQKTIEDSNAFLASAGFEETINHSHVTAFYRESGKISIKIQCLLCTPRKCIAVGVTKYSIIISNFKRHVSSFHIVTAATQEIDSIKTKLEDKSNRLIRVTQKIIEDANALLASTDFQERIDHSHVIASYGGSGNIITKI